MYICRPNALILLYLKSDYSSLSPLTTVKISFIQANKFLRYQLKCKGTFAMLVKFHFKIRAFINWSSLSSLKVEIPRRWVGNSHVTECPFIWLSGNKRRVRCTRHRSFVIVMSCDTPRSNEWHFFTNFGALASHTKSKLIDSSDFFFLFPA